jgi:nitrite reductase/ring-hydroxylating ferredoxin subunit
MILLCALSAVEPELPLRVTLVDGRSLAIFNVDGSIFATADGCTHGDASLAEGYVEGFEVECPFHQGRFDIRTGAPTAAPCTIRLQTYPVVLRDGSVYLDAPD